MSHSPKDERFEAALGQSVPLHDPLFAQSREAVDFRTPESLALAREEMRLQKEVERLSLSLVSLQRSGAKQETIDRTEAALDRAAAALVELREVEAPSVVPDAEGYISLRQLFETNLDTGESLSEAEMGFLLYAFRAFNRFMFQDGTASVGLAFKNWFAAVRRSSPEFLSALSKADVGVLLNETRAATCHREKRVVEKILKSNGQRGVLLLGGQRSEKTRRRCAKAAKGNTSRRGADRAREKRDATKQAS